MEGLQDLVANLVGVIIARPRLNNQVDGILHDDLRNLASGFVEDEPKVILGEHRVRRIGCVGVVEHFVLVIIVDDGFGSFVEDTGRLAQDGLQNGQNTSMDKGQGNIRRGKEQGPCKHLRHS